MTVQLDFSKLDLQDALDLAVLIEQEAEERYRWFADMLGERYPGDAADFFSMMARNEKRHGDELAKRRLALFGEAPSRFLVATRNVETVVEFARGHDIPATVLGTVGGGGALTLEFVLAIGKDLITGVVSV